MATVTSTPPAPTTSLSKIVICEGCGARLKTTKSSGKCPRCQKTFNIALNTTAKKMEATHPVSAAKAPTKTFKNFLIGFGATGIASIFFFVFSGPEEIKSDEAAEAIAVVAPNEPAQVQDIDRLRGAQPVRAAIQPQRPQIRNVVASVSHQQVRPTKVEVVPPQPVIYTIVRDYLPVGGASAFDSSPDIDGFFKENIDFSGGRENLTTAYNREVPKEKQTRDTKWEFIKKQPIVTDLPVLKEKIMLQDKDTPLEMEHYVSTVRSDFRSYHSTRTMSRAIDHALKENNSVTALRAISELDEFYGELLEMRIPPSAHKVHQLMLGYTRLVQHTLLLMANHGGKDEIKGVVAVRQYEMADKKYLSLIHDEWKRLDDISYQLKQGGGLGIQSGIHEGEYIIQRILPGGAAAKNGQLKPRDKILAVGQGADGPMENVAGRSDAYISGLIKGDPGTVVRLKVLPSTN